MFTSIVGAKAVTISDSGAVTALFSFPSCQEVFIDIESLPTGMLIPRAGHNSIPTAFTVSNKAASSPWCPAAAIQFAESLTSPIFAIRAAAILVIASPTAIRPDAGALSSANGVRSPSAKASPRVVLKPISVTATSATGTCHGPTIWSRAVMPPTLRSPIVIRKLLSATDGKLSTRVIASFSLILLPSRAGSFTFSRLTVRVILGGLPSNTDSGISTASFLNSSSCTINLSSAIAWPNTANGQRSRAQIS